MPLRLYGAALVLLKQDGKDPRHWQTAAAIRSCKLPGMQYLRLMMLCEYYSGDRMSYPTLRLAIVERRLISLTLLSR